MLKTLKLIGSLVVGACVGFLIAAVGLYFAKGMSFGQLLDKIIAFGSWRMIGVMLTAMALLVVAFYLQIILHEAGHLICGLATGYKFVSFRIFNLTFIRQGGRLRIKRFGIAGTGGQCLLTPPDVPLQDVPYMWYNIGGVLANLLGAAIAILLLLTVDGMSDLLMGFLVMFACTGLFCALLNGIPMRAGGICNDAENVRTLRRNPQDKQAMILQLRANALVQEGMRPKEMPEEWFQQEGEIDYKDTLQVNVKLMYAGWLQDCEQWQAAYDIYEEMYMNKDEIIGLYANELECEFMFTAWMIGRTERAEQVFSDQLLRYINTYKKVMSSKQRILCAIALYREKDAAKAREIYETVCNRRDSYLMQGEVLSDIAIMQSFLTREGVL